MSEGMCPHCGGVLGRDCFNVQECGEITHSMAESSSYLAQQVNTLTARVKELEKGLAWYADKASYTAPDWGADTMLRDYPIIEDDGQRARAILAQKGA